MDEIKYAEQAIKCLRDFIEIKKTLKRTVTEKAQSNLIDLANVMINIVENNLEDIRNEMQILW